MSGEIKKVIVAGATGYLGRFVVQEFIKWGYWVRALARNPQKLKKAGPFMESAVKDQTDEVFVMEVTKPETLSGLCDCIEFKICLVQNHGGKKVCHEKNLIVILVFIGCFILIIGCAGKNKIEIQKKLILIEMRNRGISPP